MKVEDARGVKTDLKITCPICNKPIDFEMGGVIRHIL
jgi:hypothetical protein